MFNKKLVLIVSIVLAIALVIGAAKFWPSLNKRDVGKMDTSKTITFVADQALAGGYTVPSDTKLVIKNGAAVTVDGDFLVQGSLVCENGPLNLIVKGTFSAEDLVECNRPKELASGDNGSGIAIVAESFNVSEDAIIISNSHVQMVTDASYLAKTSEDFEKLYEAIEKDRTGKFRLGPLTPLEEIPENTPGRPISKLPLTTVASSSRQSAESQNSLLGNISNLILPIARAQAPAPATDISGAPVPNTTKIGGTWVVGNPAQPPPRDLKVPTPPKGVKRIILNFNFGQNGVTINNFDLTGPDGRPGTDDVNQGCNARGGRGEDAMRMNVNAANITINNFTLRLGNGGDGGTAETTQDCEHGRATGGDGGHGGNFKMVAGDKFDIVGSFDIYPGKGGNGGKAIAHGRTGENGCPGRNGGDATATGGRGGDNKKLLVISGTVNGRDNITIHEMVAGKGADADATGGNGGDGTGPKCNGGNGGKSTATGGKGGDASCSKFSCTGGNGGNPAARPGNGGKGGTGTAVKPGGNGGKGGNASATAGKAGTGKTANGEPGNVIIEKGGNGGNGGDGCGPGKGGKGGSGKPDGEAGADGKNLCIVVREEGTSVAPPPDEEEPETTPTPDPEFAVTQSNFSFVHNIGSTSCPQSIGTFRVTGTNVPSGARWEASAPPSESWLNSTPSGNVNDDGGQLSFTCQLQEYVTQALSTAATVSVKDTSGQVLKQFTLNIKGQINAR
ncbi:hypothetical protein A2936_03900 [Candidatus Uhrbacteria bacterium RIFCSPLOWO2_01_FULL_47_25]|uniref:Uncharacterized protein n=1 Tax=Candidatus Uhrbacteria bacterium RIFCSPLOWO2_01_FULL_47_25 TaxID=1802402 RepID=A0A1F7UWM8_9BACT|nr:MAG: PE-PGRS family protein [Parcubacteria group bacterium GW2011_GWA2_46_9]OGL82702.1 MAG: hypothetical protein A2936_03900 [Candidatus Uhrbacteria bacterium RIFCSPLOWO2_01_FULL_47_25]OGL85902.1 MAG: hypothetical protein A3I37_00920 [Candidatus Uhrbacteria bacterium RIFCSPLOWO2_02_FULL_46_19]